ncbi:glycosyltransferase family 4 protein [Calothrix sp. NIES-2098]|uniref:glycosyltransferase family 4 protein n=1 Tax=Calothrix sp. NIES-2098 TaxID=1954171 RepID=UPI000B5F335E|nr:group 1 glycosyl transferase [Calothrix sp. NIES-2098]
MHNKQTILFFFPHNPYPPKSGAHKRCLEMLTGLRERGCRVILASLTDVSRKSWNVSSIKKLEETFVEKVFIYELHFWEQNYLKFLRKFYKLARAKSSLSSVLYTTPAMRSWFSKLIKEISPDLIFMNYAYWDGLINHKELRTITRVIETHDLLTLNNQMREYIQPYLTDYFFRDKDIESEILNEEIFKKLDLKASIEELNIYDKYDYTIAISQEEANIIQQHNKKSNTILIPVTQQTHPILNEYTGSAIFPIGENLFNIQGYLYFIKRVLPQILQVEPSFTVDVTGSFWNNVSLEPCPGVEIKGFVPSLEAVYQQSKFLICPVFGGTGQQVKVVEAMAYGLPVVALSQAAKSSPIKHGINGFIANNAEEFAKYSVLLWQQKELCYQLGTAARETIAKEFSRTQLLEKLALLTQPKSLNN